LTTHRETDIIYAKNIGLTVKKPGVLIHKSKDEKSFEKKGKLP